MHRFTSAVVCVLVVAPVRGRAQEPGAAPRLEVAEPIACSKIDGFENYEALEEAATKRSQKLLVYLRPTGVTYEPDDDRYKVHLVVDVNVRRKGKEKILLGRKKVVDYQAVCDHTDTNFYLGVSLGVRDFPPGEYEADLIVHDRLGQSKPVMRTLAFRVDPDSAATPKSGR